MIKTYSDFLATVNVKCAQYAQIPDDHLSFEGTKTYELYQVIRWLTGFADSATELLDMMTDDPKVDAAVEYAGSEYRQITRCLNRLAAAENVSTT